MNRQLQKILAALLFLVLAQIMEHFGQHVNAVFCVCMAANFVTWRK